MVFVLAEMKRGNGESVARELLGDKDDDDWHRQLIRWDSSQIGSSLGHYLLGLAPAPWWLRTVEIFDIIMTLVKRWMKKKKKSALRV